MLVLCVGRKSYKKFWWSSEQSGGRNHRRFSTEKVPADLRTSFATAHTNPTTSHIHIHNAPTHRARDEDSLRETRYILRKRHIQPHRRPIWWKRPQRLSRASKNSPPSLPSLPHILTQSQGSRVYYVRESLANLATSVARDQLLSLGLCLGKFTKTGKFRLHITSLSIIAPHARYKVWVKANGEMPFLYGGNVLKAHVGRWSEDCPEHQGVVVLSMNDTPLGFGVSARSTAEARKLDPTGIVTFRQADVGEYLREEDTLFTT
jgi:60S ribosome subunit biogenesis protein NIP7